MAQRAPTISERARFSTTTAASRDEAALSLKVLSHLVAVLDRQSFPYCRRMQRCHARDDGDAASPKQRPGRLGPRLLLPQGKQARRGPAVRAFRGSRERPSVLVEKGK